MSLLIVTAAASPLFSDFLVVVSVSSSTDGAPVKGLKASNFKIYLIASLNHAAAKNRPVGSVKESPDGFYVVQLKRDKVQPDLPEGHYVLGVIVTAGRTGKGQTVATGDIIV
jgi:hypothetical protein